MGGASARWSTRRSRQPTVGRPPVEGLGPERAVEADGGLVPVEDVPLDPTVRERPEPVEEREPEPAVAERRTNEEIFQPDARPAQERAERREPEREARDLASVGLGHE